MYRRCVGNGSNRSYYYKNSDGCVDQCIQRSVQLCKKLIYTNRENINIKLHQGKVGECCYTDGDDCIDICFKKYMHNVTCILWYKSRELCCL